MDVRRIVHKYRVLQKQMGALDSKDVEGIQNEIEQEIAQLSGRGNLVDQQEAKRSAVRIWGMVNECLFAQYRETCTGSSLRLQIPAAVGTAMDLVCELELLTGGE